MRIVSLLPSTTEILFDLGAGDDVVGVTFECDTPAEARSRTVVSTSAMPEGLSPAEIDAYVVGAVARGDDLYHLAAGRAAPTGPDLVVTQDLCAVCAVDVATVDEALAHLGCRAEVLTVDPHTLEEVLDSVLLLGGATGHDGGGAELVGVAAQSGSTRSGAGAGRPRPRVARARVDRPAVRPRPLDPRDGRARRRRVRARPPARSRCASRGTTSPPPGRTSWWSRRAATTGPAPRHRPTGWSRRAAAGRRARARRRRGRQVGEAGTAPGGRRRGARRGPALRRTPSPAAGRGPARWCRSRPRPG